MATSIRTASEFIHEPIDENSITTVLLPQSLQYLSHRAVGTGQAEELLRIRGLVALETRSQGHGEKCAFMFHWSY